MVLDHVHGHLAAADGPADEGHHEVLRVVEQVLVAALRGDLGEGDERVRGLRGRVARQARRLPVAAEEELAQARWSFAGASGYTMCVLCTIVSSIGRRRYQKGAPGSS